METSFVLSSDSRLANRRISQQAVDIFTIRASTRGWTYPVPGCPDTLRFKNYDSNAGDKYRWEPARPEAATIYHAGDFRDAVRACGGAAWLVSGEADVWAMYSAGISHVLACGFSEASVPNNLVDILSSFGIDLLYLAPDLDSTGERWMRRIAALLFESGIELEIHRLPEVLGAKADVGRAWASYTQSQRPFERWLLNLPRVEFKPDPIRVKPERVTSSGMSNVPFSYRERVANALGVGSYNGRGFSQAICCPHHDDTHPSAALHEDKGLYCFSEGKWFTWTETGRKLGIGSLLDDILSRQAPETSDIIQLRVETRKFLICHGMTSLARLLDATYAVGILPGASLTMSELANSCKDYGISYSSVYRALHVTPQGNAEQEIILRKLPEIFSLFSLPEEFKNNVRGRPQRIIHIPAPDEVDRVIDIAARPCTYDRLSKAELADNVAYRAAAYASIARRNPGAYPRSFLSNQIATSPRTAQNYDKKAHLKVTPRLERIPITPIDLASLPVKQERQKMYVWLETSTGKKYKANHEGGKMAANSQEKIFLVKRLSNFYEPGDQPIDTDGSTPSTDKE